MKIIATNLNIVDNNISLHYARLYFAAGYCPIPVKPRSKRPVDNEWQNLRLSESELTHHFRPTNNVSVVLGDRKRVGDPT